MNKRILIVDDEQSVLNTLKRLFRNKPYDVVDALDGFQAIEYLSNQSFDLIISDMRMPKMTGAEFLSQAKNIAPLSERILLTGFSDKESTINAINDGGIFGYSSKPWDPEQFLSLVDSALQQTHKNKLKNRALKTYKKENDALVIDIDRKEREMAQSAALVDYAHRQLVDKQELQEKEIGESTAFVEQAFQALRDNYSVTEQMLLNLLDLKLKGQREYCHQVADISAQVARALNLDESEQHLLITAARLHGVGKIGVPDAVLAVPFLAMTDAQLSEFMQYPVNTACTLMALAPFQDVAQLLYQQKEYIDGTGFPGGLSSKDIAPLAKILAIIISYTEWRFGFMNGESMSHGEAMSAIQRHGQCYDSELIKTLQGLTLEVFIRAEQTEVVLPLLSLREGMIINSDIFSDHDILLLRKGACLDAVAIKHLLNVEANANEKMTVNVRFSE
jgi:response regulator RpfG family c-di-GMP phosphodiesterase